MRCQSEALAHHASTLAAARRAVNPAAVARQTLQQRQAFPIKAAKGLLLLHAPGHHSPQQVLAQTRRRRFAQKAEIEAVNAGWIDFFNKGDFAGVASLYAEDAVEGAARA